MTSGGVVSTSSTTRSSSTTASLRWCGLDKLDHRSRSTSRAQLDHPREGLLGLRLEPAQQAVPALLGGHREQPVVAPVAVDVEVPGRVADLAEPKLLHDPEAGGVLGPDGDLDAVQVQLQQAVVDDHRDRGRDHVLPRVASVDPVPDLRPTGRAADDVGDRDLPGELAVDGQRERQRTAFAGLAPQVADQSPEAARRGAVPGRDGRLPRPEPLDVAPAHLVPGRGVAAGQRPQAHPARLQLYLPAGQWSLPVICSTAWTSIGASTARPSFTPPRDPGRFTTRACPHTPARPRESAAVGTPAATP